MPTQLRMRPSRLLPKNMTDAEWARFLSEGLADFYRGGQDSFDSGVGFWIGVEDGIFKLSFGDSAGNKVTWDGTTLSIVGNITATTGTIGGWTIATTYLESGSGANTVRLDSVGTNPAISAGSATPGSAPFRVTQAGALVATSATITGAITATSGSFTGGVTVGSGGSLSSGQSAYDTGTGFWFEYNSGTPRFSIGNAAGNKLTWNGTTLALTGALTFANSASTFTPTWTGFSADPSGDISYLDFGVYVVLYIGSALTGTSNTTAMSITNLPSGIRPSTARNIPSAALVDNGVVTHVGGADVNTDGTFTFGLLVTDLVANRVNRNNTAFTNSGSKGLAAGFLVIYPK